MGVVKDFHNIPKVTVVHVSAVAKNSADDKLRQKLHHFAHTYHPPCTVVLISGDVNFAAELKDLRHAHNITITLVHNIQTSDALKVFANNLVLFDDLLQDLEQPTMQPVSNTDLFLLRELQFDSYLFYDVRFSPMLKGCENTLLQAPNDPYFVILAIVLHNF